jgi:hypothetical protein
MLEQDTTTSVYRILLNLFTPPSPPSPTISVTSFVFAGTLGSSSAQPRVVVSNANATSLSWTLNQSASTVDSSFSPLSTGTVASPTGTDTITYGGVTTNERWYYYSVTATNAVGSTTVTTSHLQNYAPPPPPTLVFVNQGFNNAGDPTPQPFVVVNVSGFQPTVSWQLWQQGRGGPDFQISNGTVIGFPSGNTTITYFGSVTFDVSVYFIVSATNIYGSATPITTDPMLNNAA